ncbi:MAG: DUF2292 domain-containing protein [Geobacter sp.]|nr:MAG: DUF2292 domain-containing protein [Geobacter sp.]
MVTPSQHTAKNPWNRELELVVREALESIRFGTVTLVVQDGRVVQVEKNEKIRLNRPVNMDGAGI